MAKQFECSVLIEATAAQVWAAIADTQSFARWMPGFVRVETISPGPMHQGMIFRETRKMFGHDSTEEFEVVGLEPEVRLQLRIDGSKGTTGKGLFEFDHTLSAEGTATRMTLSGTITMPGFFTKLFGGLFIGMFKGAIAKDLAALKTYVEKTAKDPQ